MLGTRFSSFINKVNFAKTIRQVNKSLQKKFKGKTFFYKPHPYKDTDLNIPNSYSIAASIPAELLIPFFDHVCFFDSSSIFSAKTKYLYSVINLVEFDDGDNSADKQTLINNVGPKNLNRIKFL